jgi:hypothetical protein
LSNPRHSTRRGSACLRHTTGEQNRDRSYQRADRNECQSSLSGL